MGDLNKETIEAIVNLSGGRAEGIINPLTSDRKIHYRTLDGEIREFDINPEPRAHRVATLVDLVRAQKTFAIDGKESDIFIGESVLACLLDSGDRRDGVCMDLRNSEPYTTLLALADDTDEDIGHDVPQGEFVRLLQTRLAGCVDPDIVAACKMLKVEASGAVTSGIGQGQRSMGKDVDERVTGRDKLPETIHVNFPIYANAELSPFKVQVTASLIVTPQMNFTLFVSEHEFARVIHSTLEWIRDWLTAAGASKDRVFIGTP